MNQKTLFKIDTRLEDDGLIEPKDGWNDETTSKFIPPTREELLKELDAMKPDEVKESEREDELLDFFDNMVELN